MTARIRLRRADYGNWDSDEPTLDHGEIGLIYDEVDGNETIVGWVVGNGDQVWSDLPINRPPTAGDRTGLGDGDGIENDGNAPVSYDNIALLTLDNTFAGDNWFNGLISVKADDPATEDSLTVHGSLKVKETAADLDDGNVTVENGDVTLEDGNLTIPLFDSDNDTPHLMGAVGSTGAINFCVQGPHIGNSGVQGKVMSATEDDTYGPWIQVRASGIWLGGYKDASGEEADQTELRYSNSPADATSLTELANLVVPTKKLVVDYVGEYVEAARWRLYSFDPPGGGWVWQTLARNVLYDYNLYSHSVGDSLPVDVTSGVTHIQIMATCTDGNNPVCVVAGKGTTTLGVGPTCLPTGGVGIVGIAPTASDDHDQSTGTSLVPIDANGDFSVCAFASGSHAFGAKFTIVGYSM